ncbi:tol-pal system protein YbgF [Piscirickettsia litoralis]|uniref:Cell division coordinator CpoB n=1 Tax=Piscirickettsia litoralis TaxID=1891921 RepID=A0ABX3A8D2_9GAMM|nr:tol-pal system protein YbgF [Piscirickettsia litoralis]ODN43820.1 tol-pal system protein YbgF [Piscirickettsia litoralis]
MSLRRVLTVCSGVLVITSSFAAAPVESLGAGVTPSGQAYFPAPPQTQSQSIEQPVSASASQSYGQSQILTVQQQLTKLDNQISLLLPLKNQLQYLQQRVDRLQGEVDEKNYKISQLKKELQAMFNGIDSRMLVLEGSTTKTQAASAAHAQTVSAAEIDSSHAGNTPINAKERYAYQAAYQLLSERKYSDAVVAFERFLKLYPKGPYTVSAYFWLGEIYIIEGMPDKAMVALRKIVKNYPHSDKAPSAAYHLGTIYVANGDAEHAKEMFMKVVKEFPDTKSARLAKEQLKQLSS